MESPKKAQPKASLSPLNKSQKSDDEPAARPKSPETDSNTSVGRSGRVRKAKVVFDPSDVDIKRRSMPIMDVVPKAKRAPKATVAPQNAKEPAEIKAEPNADAEDDDAEEEFTAVAPIAKRRKTISVAALDNGCIVCLRADVKKGRFVNCIGCTKRGHFTCLRNDKLFKTADSERCWQCPSCKICKNCMKSKPNDQLYKCVLCHSSYHLHCLDPMPKNVARKRFTCTGCSLTALPLPPDDVKPKLAAGKKSAGFAGFTHDETAKSNDTKAPAEPASASTAKKPTIAAAAAAERVQAQRHSTSSKSSGADQKPSAMDMLEFEIKEEVPTPSSDRNAIRFDRFDASDQIKPHPDDAIAESVGYAACVDLKVAADDEQEDIGSAEPAIQYDKASRIKPHENIPDCRHWDCDEVYTYFMGTTTAEYAELFKENEIDGDALLLMKRDDVLNRFNLKLGPALRLYAHIVSLQYKNNNPILTWNEY